MAEYTPLRFGIVGCGTASIPVGEAMVASPHAELSAVYDLNRELAEDLGHRFNARVMTTLEKLLTDVSVDAVYIAVPHHLLAPLTRQALDSGKHALTEKPLAISLYDVDQLIRLASERKLALGVFYEMRYAPAHATARKLVRSGAIGTVTSVQMQTLIDKPLSYWQSGYSGRSANPWRSIKAQAGGGVVLMNSSHLLDALFYITGLRVTSVSAEVATFTAGVEVEDSAVATLHFDNGALGSLIAGAHIPGAHDDEFCVLYGTGGQIRLPDPYGVQPLRLYLNRGWQEFRSGEWYSIPGETVPVYRQAIDDFVTAVQAGGCIPIDAHAARQVLAVVLGIYQSAAEKRFISIS